jgi:hypothetical protein
MAVSPFLVDEQNPWPGLSSFTESAQAYFFGRENEIREILSRIEARPFTLLFGQSGLGKSSLLQAGIMPRLRKKNYLPVYFRLDYEAGAPGLDEQIGRALLRSLAEIGAPAPARPPGSVEGESLWEWFHRADTRLTDADGRTLIPIFIIDQFEEIFTLGERDAATRTRSLAWFRSLAYLVENWCPPEVKDRLQEHEALLEEVDLASHPIRILISMREDFLPHLDERESEMPSAMLNRLRLTPLRGTEALEAVLRPAPRLVRPPVAEAIVRFVAGQPQAELQDFVVATPILNLVCRELNERRKARNLSVITPDLIEGDAGKILRQFYEECLAGQPPGLRIFIEEEMLSASGHRENISEERADRIMARAGLPKSALDELVARRLLQKEERLGRIRFELIHDVLCGPIAQSRAERATREKEEKDLAEKKAVLAKIRQIRRRLVLAGVGLLVGAVLLAYALWEGHQARQRSAQLSRIITMMNKNHKRLIDIGSAYPEFVPMETDVFTRDLDDINEVIEEGGVNNDVLWLKLSALLDLSDLLPADKNGPEKLKRTEEAMRIADELIKSDHDPDDQARLGLYLGAISEAFYQLHQNERSQHVYDQAIHVLDRVVNKDPAVVHNWKALLIKSSYFDRLAVLTADQKDALLSQSVAEARLAYQAQPDAIEYADNLAQMLITRASYLNDLQPGSAEVTKILDQIFELEKQISPLTDKLASDKDIVSYRNNMAEVFKTMGGIEQENDRWDNAEDSFRNYVESRELEIAKDPSSMGKDYNYNTQRNLLASAYNDRGDFERARAKAAVRDVDKRDTALNKAQDAYQASLQIGKALTEASPKESDYWETLGNTYAGLKELAIDRANLALNAQPPDLASASQFYQVAHNGLEDHITALRQASAMADPDEQRQRSRSVAIALREEGEFEVDRAKAASEDATACRHDALDCYNGSLALLAVLLKDHPHDTDMELTSALAHEDLFSLAQDQAEAASHAGHDTEARGYYQSGEKEVADYLQAMQELVAQQKAAQADDLDNESTLVNANVSQGDLYRSEANHLKSAPPGLFAKADQCYQNALALAQTLTAQHPEVAGVWSTLAEVDESMDGSAADQASAALSRGDVVQAKAFYQKANDQVALTLKAARQALALATGAERSSKMHKVASALGTASYDLLFVGQYAAAQQDATAAIWDDPTELWVTTNQAHALLLEGKFDEAWTIYQQLAFERIYSDDKETFRDAVLDDFDAFQKAKAFFTPQQLADIEKARRQLQALSPPAPSSTGQ